MGLDTFFFVTTPNALDDVKDYGFEVKRTGFIRHEFGYFRKDWDLCELLYAYYVSIGGKEPMEDFNCMNLRVTQNTVNFIRERYSPDFDNYKEVKGVLSEAEDYLKNEENILYTYSWW